MESFAPSPHQTPFSKEQIVPSAVLQQIAAQPTAADSRLRGALSRTIDVAISALALLLLSPLMLAIALLIRLDSPGPALFRQRRVGRGGRLFTFYKFRTMYADARARFPELYRYQYSAQELSGLYFKVPNDPRLTRVGRWLRQSTLDELPNFMSVLLGDMALVGPRPEIPEMLPYYQPHELRKFSVRPGVTGLAQISGRGALRFHETVAYDLEYCDRRTPLLDIAILLRTVEACVRRRGAF